MSHGPDEQDTLKTLRNRERGGGEGGGEGREEGDRRGKAGMRESEYSSKLENAWSQEHVHVPPELSAAGKVECQGSFAAHQCESENDMETNF